MVLVDSQVILNAESSKVIGGLWAWALGDVGEDGKDEFIGEADNCDGGY